MKKLLMSMAFASVMAIGFAQTNGSNTTTVVQPDGSVATIVKANNLSWEDAAAAVAIARSMNMDPTAVITQRGTISAPFYQLAPAYVIQQQSGKPLSDIWNMYNGGMTWMQIANQLNLAPTYYNAGNTDTSGWNNDQFTQGVWQTMLQNNYAMTPDDWSYFHTNNIQPNEVVVGEVLARETNHPARDIVTLYNGNNDWAMVDHRFATDMGLANNGMDQSTSPTNSSTMSSSSTSTTQTMPAQNGNTTSDQSNGSMADKSTSNNSDAMSANHQTQTAPANPIQEWQVNGANVNAYMTGQSSSTSVYGLSRHHRSSHRSRRHHRR